MQRILLIISACVSFVSYNAEVSDLDRKQYSDDAYNKYLQQYLKHFEPLTLLVDKHIGRDPSNIVRQYNCTFKQWQENLYKLMETAQNNQVEEVKKIIEFQEIDVNSLVLGSTALMWAIVFGCKGTVKLLLEYYQTNVDRKDENGSTALMLAIIHGGCQLWIVELLLELGANPNIANNAGETALMLAIMFCNKDIVKLLLTYGADANNIKNSNGKTALAIALQIANTPYYSHSSDKMRVYKEIAEILQDHKNYKFKTSVSI